MDSFFNQHLFIRLAWCLYFKASTPHAHSEEYNTYYTQLSSLISTTGLNTQLLAHALYYHHLLLSHKASLFPCQNSDSFHSKSRVKLLSGDARRNIKELTELLVVLLMLSNKAHDDSSYTMKTWENLTPLSLSVLKKREITVLKKINYNVFLTAPNYARWIDTLQRLCYKYELIIDPISPKTVVPSPAPYYMLSSSSAASSVYESYPLTPRSPFVDVAFVPLQPVQVPPTHTQTQHHSSSMKRMLDTTDGPQQESAKRMRSGQLLTPVKSVPFPQPPSQPLSLHLPQAAAQIQIQTQTHNFTIEPQPMRPPPALPQQQGYSTGLNNNVEFEDQLIPHPIDCRCCALTNLANGYFRGEHLAMRSML